MEKYSLIVVSFTIFLLIWTNKLIKIHIKNEYKSNSEKSLLFFITVCLFIFALHLLYYLFDIGSNIWKSLKLEI